MRPRRENRRGLFLAFWGGLEKFCGVSEGDAGGVAAAEHAGDFFDAGIRIQRFDASAGAAGLDRLADGEVAGAACGDRGQMGDGDDLSAAGGFGELAADGVGGFAADVGVDFVEDEQGDAVGLCEDDLDGEHDARDFAGGSDGAEGAHGFAGVGGEAKFGAVDSGGGRGVQRMEGDGERAVAEAEGAQFGGDGEGEFVRSGVAAFAESFAELAETGVGVGDQAFNVGPLAVAVAEVGEALAGGIERAQDVGDGRAIFALELVVCGKAAVEPVEAYGIGIDVGQFALDGDGKGGEGVGMGAKFCGPIPGGGQEASEFVEGLAGGSEGGEGGMFVIGDGLDEELAEFEDALGVAGGELFGADLFFFAIDGSGLFDFLDAEGQEIDLGVDVAVGAGEFVAPG